MNRINKDGEIPKDIKKSLNLNLNSYTSSAWIITYSTFKPNIYYPATLYSFLDKLEPVRDPSYLTDALKRC
jgi:hypothetical protein